MFYYASLFRAVRSSFVYKLRFFIHHSRLFHSGNIYYVLKDFNLRTGGIRENEELKFLKI